MRCTPYDELPAVLATELTEAGLDPREVYDFIVAALEEDLPGPRAVDVTSAATIDADDTGVADLNICQDGVVAGLGVAEMVFRVVMGREVRISDRLADGTGVHRGNVAMTVAGPVRGLLTAERTALNFACHLSGVATATSQWTAALADTGARVLDTRKTLPRWRALQKYAVRCGGGTNHRFSLADMALVKDNHVIAAGGVVQALEAVRRDFPGVPVEVEVTSLDQLAQLLEVGVERVLLDNMDDATMRKAVEVADGRCLLEASGGLTLQRAREVGATGVDFISVGALTHSVQVFDIGMDLRS